MKHKHNGIHAWGRPKDLQICHMSGKVVFDKRGAETARNRRYEEDHTELRIYQCPYGCGGWHLTSRLSEKHYDSRKK